MSESKDPLEQADIGLGGIEKLIKLLKPLIGTAVPDFRTAARDLQKICNKLLDANEHLTVWINRFRDFDLDQPDTKSKFNQLAGEYRALKIGRRYQELKFDCRDIETIYKSHISGRLKEIFGGDKSNEAQAIFEELSSADAALVHFVHEVIFESLDDVCGAMENAIERGDIETAKNTRLQFKVRSGTMFMRLQVIGTELSELVLDFKQIAFGA